MLKLILGICVLIIVQPLQAQNVETATYKADQNLPFGAIHPDAPKALTDYEAMIGICDCRSTQRNNQGVFQDTIDAIWQFKYILNGTAIQDESWKSDGSYTSSIRQYNQDSLKWYVTFFSSTAANPAPRTWSGIKEANEDIVLWLSQKAPNGMAGFSRLTFHDISEEGFNWKGEWVDEQGTITFPFWTMSCKKRL